MSPAHRTCAHPARHRRARAASPSGPPGPSDVLFLVLAALTLLGAATAVGGLLAAPYGL